ncbi:hypothetical protein N9736_01170 [Amylibacter sp.]|nr:hypothetical protein [Amylibacter sp.]MDC1414105.1 hypothetical protein [Amylibacter sp.]
MKIIGINDGHNASAALSVDGQIVFALSEERPKRLKNFWGFPDSSLEYIYQNHCKKNDIDFFGIFRSSSADFLVHLWGRSSGFKKYSLLWFVSKGISRLGVFAMPLIDKTVPNSVMIYFYAKRFGVDRNKIILVNHHRAHAESAAFSLNKKKSWLIFSVDAEGDLESATVYKLASNKLDKLTSISRNHSLGYFYTWITEYLGMKPNQHEFKVMGLEPYVRKNTKEFERTFSKLDSLFKIDDLNYKATIPTVGYRFKRFLKKELAYERFDNIAAAAQWTLERIVIQWILNWIKITGVRNVALSGGTMMNVKLAQKISLLDDIEDFYVMPSSGDETTVLGVCNFINNEKSGSMLEPLKDLYLGVSWSDNDLSDWVRRVVNIEKYQLIHEGEGLEDQVANLLAAGKIVARFNGRDEFGARALGNRSILAHPSNPKTISTINKLIKDRDFWMPFTPSVLKEKCSLYLKNPKNLLSPYMAMTFETTDEGAEVFSAATHPYDKTMRVQMVSADWNQSYHKLISSFGEKTGIFGVLNTSFNLHGEPNVFTPDDALSTVERSGLKYLAIGKYLLKKNEF